MINPVLCIWDTIQSRTLDVDALVRRVKADIADRRGAVCGWRLDTDGLKKWWHNQVNLQNRESKPSCAGEIISHPVQDWERAPS